MKVDYTLFLKVGERQYMESLINEGSVFCKTIHYFNQIDTKDLRGDKHDGASYLKQISSLELRVDGKTIGKADAGQLYLNQYGDEGNIYCMYGVETQELNRDSNKKQRLNLNMNGLSFGDTAVIIFNPGEFVKRVNKAVGSRGFKPICSPVFYHDHKKIEGKLSPFHKSNKYSEQKEVRFWIPNDLNTDLCFKIGDMSDISYLLPKDKLNDIYYEPV